MASYGAASPFEVFVSSQLQALFENLVAEHNRLLMQYTGRSEAMSSTSPFRGPGAPSSQASSVRSSVQSTASTFRAGVGGVAGGSGGSGSSVFKEAASRRKSLFGCAAPRDQMQQALQRQLLEKLRQQQLLKEKVDSDDSDDSDSDSSDGEETMPPTSPQAQPAPQRMSMSVVPPPSPTGNRRGAGLLPSPVVPVERVAVMPPALMEEDEEDEDEEDGDERIGPEPLQPRPSLQASPQSDSKQALRRGTLKLPGSPSRKREDSLSVMFANHHEEDADAGNEGAATSATPSSSKQGRQSVGEAEVGSPRSSGREPPPLNGRKSSLWQSPIPEEEEEIVAKKSRPTKSEALFQRSGVRRRSAPSVGSISQDVPVDVANWVGRQSRSSEKADLALASRTAPHLAIADPEMADLALASRTAPHLAVADPEMDVRDVRGSINAAGSAGAQRATLLKKLGVIPASMQLPQSPKTRESLSSSLALPQQYRGPSTVSAISGMSGVSSVPFADEFSMTNTPSALFTSQGTQSFFMPDTSGMEPASTCFTPLPVWEAQQCSMSQDLRRGKAFLSAWHQMMMATDDIEEDGTATHGIGRLLNVKVATPHSHRRLIWDLLALAFVVHDAFFIPLEFVGFQETEPMRIISWATRIFWSLDMIASLLAGFESVDGSFEGRLGPVVCRYARTWLLPDTVLVTASWTEVLITIPSSQERLIYLIQMARMLRLVRLVRIKAALSLIYARLRSERLALLASILQSLSGVIVVVHVIACCWVGLGRIRNLEGGESWVAAERLDLNDHWVLYAIAFHWSLTQFYGSMELFPHNVTERFFAIGALLAGFFIATAFVSSVTSSMTRLHIITSQQSSHMLILKKYLQERGISRRLASRVQLNAKFAIAEQQRNIEEGDVEMLQLVSEPLRVELHLEVYGPALAKHPLFGRLLTCNPAAMRQVCHVAVSTMSVSKDDILFSRGEVPSQPKMLFLADGALKYTQDGMNFQQLLVGEWAVEAVLWTTWVYHGMLTACEQSRIIMLDANLFQEIAGNSQTEELALGPYAFEFVKMLNACANVRSDLGTGFDTDSLVASAYPRSEIKESCEPKPTKPSNKKKKRKKRNSMRNAQIQPGQLDFGPPPEAFSSIMGAAQQPSASELPSPTSADLPGKPLQPELSGPGSPSAAGNQPASYRLSNYSDDNNFFRNSLLE